MEKPDTYYPPDKVIHRVERHIHLMPKDGCWEWPMSRTKAGYGQLMASDGPQAGRRLHYAHRVSYAVNNGPIPQGFQVCHTCDNPGCFRPDHLFLGTPKDNAADCKEKGRNSAGKTRPIGNKHWTRTSPHKKASVMVGENHFRAKLNWQKVDYIRTSPKSGAELSRELGVSQSTICSVRKNHIWNQSSLLAKSDADSL